MNQLERQLVPVVPLATRDQEPQNAIDRRRDEIVAAMERERQQQREKQEAEARERAIFRFD